VTKAKGKKCRNFCCDNAADPLRCEITGEGDGSTDDSRTPTELTRLLHAISRFQAKVQIVNQKTEFQEMKHVNAGLMYSDAWGWLSMSERPLISNLQPRSVNLTNC
jgi:hypothetical protein